MRKKLSLPAQYFLPEIKQINTYTFNWSTISSSEIGSLVLTHKEILNSGYSVNKSVSYNGSTENVLFCMNCRPTWVLLYKEVGLGLSKICWYSPKVKMRVACNLYVKCEVYPRLLWPKLHNHHTIRGLVLALHPCNINTRTKKNLAWLQRQDLTRLRCMTGAGGLLHISLANRRTGGPSCA